MQTLCIPVESTYQLKSIIESNSPDLSLPRPTQFASSSFRAKRPYVGLPIFTLPVNKRGETRKLQ